MSILAYVHATTTPTPTPSDVVEEVSVQAKKWWDFLLGAPLDILIILVCAGLVLMVLRKLIKKVTENLATESENTWFPNSEKAKALKAVNPLANARRAQRSRTIGSVLRSVASIVVGAITILLTLDKLAVNIAPLLASAGIVGVAIGFGAQALVKDFISGIFLILEDQYGVGDQVEIGDVSGTVESVALRVTKVRDSEGTLWYLRNGDVLKVGNKTHGWAVAAVEVRVPYSSDLEQVRAALRTAADRLKANKKISPALRGDIDISGIESMSASALSLKVNVKTLPARQWEVARELRESIRAELNAQNLEMAAD